VLEYLAHTLLEARRLLPTQGEARWEVLRWHALAHGLIDATVTRLLDLRRPEPLRSAEVRAREEVRIARTLDSLEKDIAARHLPEPIDPCRRRARRGLQYIDFRYPHDWRDKRPELAGWIARVATRPSFAETLPPSFTRA